MTFEFPQAVAVSHYTVSMRTDCCVGQQPYGWQWQCVDGGTVGVMVDDRISVKPFTAVGQCRIFYVQNPVACSKLRFYSPLTVSIAEIAFYEAT